MPQTLELTQQQPFVMRIDGVEYNVTYPVAAVAKLEMTLNRGMRSLADWLKITAEELPALLEVGLEQKHLEKAKQLADAVCGTLPAEEIETVIEALCETTFPKATERYRAAVAEMQQRAADALVPHQEAPADEVRA